MTTRAKAPVPGSDPEGDPIADQPARRTSVRQADEPPLYLQVREQLLDRIRTGVWRPAQLIPNEFEIAEDFGVSQGTARKALDTLASDGFLVRRQGKGTFVVEHTPAGTLFRYFHIYDESGAQITPGSDEVRPLVVRATDAQRARLKLPRGAKVITIDRIRTRAGVPFIIESITLPEQRFPGLGDAEGVPNTLYDLYQKNYGVFIARADELITPIVALETHVAKLPVALGAPLLVIDRIAFDLDSRPVEWRFSICDLTNAHYMARLR
jgi:GntR family transcriptional regulator